MKKPLRRLLQRDEYAPSRSEGPGANQSSCGGNGGGQIALEPPYAMLPFAGGGRGYRRAPYGAVGVDIVEVWFLHIVWETCGG